MTKTVQLRSVALLDDTGKNLVISKPGIEDNIRLLLSLYDNLNILCEKLHELDYLLNRKELKLILYENIKGDTK